MVDDEAPEKPETLDSNDQYDQNKDDKSTGAAVSKEDEERKQEGTGVVEKEGSREVNEEDDSWYKAKDGSFFLERREPFFYFNLLICSITFSIFLYFTYSITTDYMRQQNNPPTATKTLIDLTQQLPAVMICNNDPTAPITLLHADFHANAVGGGEKIELTEHIQPVICPMNEDPLFNATNITSSGVNSTDPLFSIQQQRSCIQLDFHDDNFSAFADIDSDSLCLGDNSFQFVFDIHRERYSNDTLAVGAVGYLHLPGEGERMIDKLICQLPIPECKKLEEELGDNNECSDDLQASSFDQFYVSVNAGSKILLQRSEIQYKPRCEQFQVSWNPTTMIMQLNDNAYKKLVLDGYENNSMDFTTQVQSLRFDSVETIVYIEISFQNPRVSKTTFNPISGQSMFGSLSGWYGFLSDGWGCISFVYFLERTIMYFRHRTQQL